MWGQHLSLQLQQQLPTLHYVNNLSSVISTDRGDNPVFQQCVTEASLDVGCLDPLLSLHIRGITCHVHPLAPQLLHYAEAFPVAVSQLAPPTTTLQYIK